MTEHLSHLVIGAGAMGLATTWRLAQSGLSPVTLEQFERGHTRGASHGATRNFNNAYGHAHYLDLLDDARRGWDELSAYCAEPLLRLHGLVTHGNDDVVQAIYEGLTARGADAEVWTADQASARWPGMRFDGAVLLTRDAGVVRAAAALEALETAARAEGADIRYGHRVVSLDETPDGVHVVVESADGGYEIHAETVVVTAGAWTRRVIGDAVSLPRLTVTEESPAHFAERSDDLQWPSFNHLVRHRQDSIGAAEYPGNVYGMPAPGEGVKVGFHLVGQVVDPDARTFTPLPELEDTLRAYVREWFPGLDADSAEAISCTYTSTDSEDFVLDRRGRIVVGAGFSGHGFKFTPAVGEVLARLAIDPDAQAAAPFRLLEG